MATPKKVMISACLLGENCRYDGANSKHSQLLKLLETAEIIPACPEVEGGLPTPRPPAEIIDGKVLRASGEDVTHYFQQGAQVCLERAQAENVSLVILKSRSPSCGCGEVYDGSFTSTLKEGNGIFTDLLISEGIDCLSDETFFKENNTATFPSK